MKLPNAIVCVWTLAEGNFKTHTTLVERGLGGLSDRGSIPLISTNARNPNLRPTGQGFGFLVFICDIKLWFLNELK